MGVGGAERAARVTGAGIASRLTKAVGSSRLLCTTPEPMMEKTVETVVTV